MSDADGFDAGRATSDEPDPDWLREWFDLIGLRSRAYVLDFIHRGFAAHTALPGAAELARVLERLVLTEGGRFSTMACLGWLAVRPTSGPAGATLASLELLQASGAVHRDLSRGSRGRTAIARWARRTYGDVPGVDSAGAAGAHTLSELGLVWADSMLYQSGMPEGALARGRPAYDRLREDVVLGKYLDLLPPPNARHSFDDVLNISGARSGNHGLLLSLDFGAQLAGCDPDCSAYLGLFGRALTEGVELRRQLTLLHQDPFDLGGAVADRLLAGDAAAVERAAYDHADARQHARLSALADRRPQLYAERPRRIARRAQWAAAYQQVLRRSDVRRQVERMINDRRRAALTALASTTVMPGLARQGLRHAVERWTA